MRTVQGKERFFKVAALIGAAIFPLLMFFSVRALAFPRPYRQIVLELEADEALVYAVVKAESGFREDAVSRAGAVGLMQLLPSTAEFVCQKYGISFSAEKLKEGEYNLRLGCLYLKYLLGRFQAEGTALAAYNAGEGTVAEWLKDPALSEDGVRLKGIPYPETAGYVKKVEKFRKNYRFFYHLGLTSV